MKKTKLMSAFLSLTLTMTALGVVPTVSAAEENAPVAAVTATNDTESQTTADNKKFDEKNFFVVVGTYEEKYTLLRYLHLDSDGDYYDSLVVWKEAPEDIAYGDIFTSKGEAKLKAINLFENDPVYNFSYYTLSYYYLEEGTKLNKIGNCTDLMEQKDLIVTSRSDNGYEHWGVNYYDGSYYKLRTSNSDFGVDPIDCKSGDIVTFAVYKEHLVIPLSINTPQTVQPKIETQKFDEKTFFVYVGKYGSDPLLYYCEPNSEGGYYRSKVIWKDAPADLVYGDVLTADGDVTLTRIQSAPGYEMVYYYEFDKEMKLNKVGNCTDLMEHKDMTLSEILPLGMGQWVIYFSDDSQYSYHNSWTALGVDPANKCKGGDVITFAAYDNSLIIPLAINDSAQPVVTTNETVSSDLSGDANCDDEVSMADAVLIMQAIANPDKYGTDSTNEIHITEQGKKNADIAGDGDGLTNADALAIQKKLLMLD